jgi:fluoride exporter
MNLLLVALGGAIGSVLRYLAAKGVQNVTGALFPWGTMFVNVVGCFVIGVLWGLDERSFLSSRGKDFLWIGVLGGFTTFSSFGFETGKLLADGQWLFAAGNVLLSNVIGIAMVFVGVVSVRALLGWLR